MFYHTTCFTECELPPLRNYTALGLSISSKVCILVINFHGGRRYKAVKSAYHRSFNEIQLVKVELESLQQEVTNFKSLYQITISKLHITHTKYTTQKSCRLDGYYPHNMFSPDGISSHIHMYA